MFTSSALLMKFLPYIVAGAAVFGVYVYITHLQGKVEVLTADNITLGVAVETQSATIDEAQKTIGNWAKDREDLLNEIEKLSQVAKAARSESRAVRAKLQKLADSTDPEHGVTIANDLTGRLNFLLGCASRGEDCGGDISTAGVKAELTPTPTN